MSEPRTSKPEYGPYILEALEAMGHASVNELMETTYSLMRPRLHPADLKTLPGNVPRWRRQAEYMLEGLIESGYIEESPGSLSLTRRGLEYLSAF